MDRIAELQESYLHQVAALPEGRPPGERLRRVRWMLEELRVSLWAQQLGTAYPVSDAADPEGAVAMTAWPEVNARRLARHGLADDRALASLAEAAAAMAGATPR